MGPTLEMPEGVLEDEREQDVSRRQPKRVFNARVGRRSRTSCGAGVATRGVLPSYTNSGLDRTVFLSNALTHQTETA